MQFLYQRGKDAHRKAVDAHFYECKMNRVIPILFALGFNWVPFMLVPAIAFFFSDGWKESHIISVAALAGFCVWFGWGWHCLTGRFPFVSDRIFWSISFLAHLVWLGILWDLVLLNVIWTVPNLVVAFIGMLPESQGSGWKRRIGSFAAFGIPMAFASVVVLAHAEEFRWYLAGVWLLGVIAIVLLKATFGIPRHSEV